MLFSALLCARLTGCRPSFDCWRSFSSLFPFVWLGEGHHRKPMQGTKQNIAQAPSKYLVVGKRRAPFRSAISEVFRAVGSKRRKEVALLTKRRARAISFYEQQIANKHRAKG